jgi:hypothetical protein
MAMGNVKWFNPTKAAVYSTRWRRTRRIHEHLRGREGGPDGAKVSYERDGKTAADNLRIG